MLDVCQVHTRNMLHMVAVIMGMCCTLFVATMIELYWTQARHLLVIARNILEICQALARHMLHNY